MPLVIFLILGTLQLFMMLQGRIMAEYAAFQAVRAGSRHHGDCMPMMHAALAGLLPSVTPYLGGSGGGSAAEKLADAWEARIGSVQQPNPRYVQGKGMDGKHNGPIFWLARESPRVSDVNFAEDLYFDSPKGDGSEAMRLEVRLIYWYRLRIPFADWVISRMLLAHMGLKNYDAVNPLMPADTKAGWTKDSKSTINLDSLIRDELSSRVNSGQYVFPIQATYGMRMMTPARRKHFEQQNCNPAPEDL